MIENEEAPSTNVEESTVVEETTNARPESVSSSEDTNEDGSSTPPAVRKTRSSGPLSISNKIFESINTTRRSARRDSFLKSTDSDVSRPRIGIDFQADIPDIIEHVKENAKDADDKEVNKSTLMWIPGQWDANFDSYCEIARVCRKVPIDIALKHLFDRKCDLKQALVDFETLPIVDSVQWSKDDFTSLVKKIVQNRRLNVIQKQFVELGKTGAQVVEKRYEIFHQLCYGPSHWLCPKMRNCTDEMSITYRSDCENCFVHLYKSSNDTLEVNRQLCNACQLYTKITSNLRPFSTPINEDLFIKKGLELVKDYESEDEHYDCFAQTILEERRRTTEWTTKEEEQCVKGFRKHGLNYEEIAEELGNKTESQVEKFYLLNRYRYSIDALVASSEKERETDLPQLPRPRRTQEDGRTPTPAAEEIDNKKEVEDPQPNINARKNQVVEATA